MDSVTKKSEDQVVELSLTSSENDDVLIYREDERKDRYQKKKSLSDILTIVCSGCALLSDGYQNNCMTMLNSLFSILYATEYTKALKTRVSNALFVGAILGQVSVGLTCDYMGRKWAIVFTTCMIILGTILATASSGTTVDGMFWMFTIARGITGFGVGGEYPASSTGASEAANETVKRRGGVFCLVTNLPLSLGGPFALIVFIIVYSICGSDHLSTTWRVTIGLGIVWPLVLFYFRFRMDTTLLYKKSAIKKNVPYFLAVKYYWRRLIGTLFVWLCYDFVVFPFGVFSSTIISTVIHNPHNLTILACWTLLLSVIGIPGVLIGAYIVDKLGRKWTMMIGFTGVIVFSLIVGCAYDKLKKIVPLFIIFYGLITLFGNLGPGNCIGLSSSECYATPVRGTFYGLSAAVGKVGAAIGTQVFTKVESDLGNNWTFIIAAIVGLLGLLLTYLCIPHLTDDDLMMEDINFENYLIKNGWTGTFGLKEDEVVDDQINNPA